jgi:hypothetical protein
VISLWLLVRPGLWPVLAGVNVVPARARRRPGRGCTWSPAALRLVGRLAGAGRDARIACLPAAVLELVLAREWLLRRAGLSGCEPATLETASVPGCPPGSLPLPVPCRRASAIIRWWSVSLIVRFRARSAALRPRSVRPS